MTRFAPLGFALALSLALSAQADDKKAVPKELEPFQGAWQVSKAELNGKTVEGPKLRFTFTAAKVEYLSGEQDTGTGWVVVVDAKKDPAEIDLFTDGGKKSQGIYKFEGDGAKLLVCFVRGDEKRPRKFDSTDLPDSVLLTLEKAKK